MKKILLIVAFVFSLNTFTQYAVFQNYKVCESTSIPLLESCVNTYTSFPHNFEISGSVFVSGGTFYQALKK